MTFADTLGKQVVTIGGVNLTILTLGLIGLGVFFISRRTRKLSTLTRFK